MAVDEKRAQMVFQAAIEATDPGHQAVILERECASDPELRKRVEWLLRSHREMATIVGMPPATNAQPASSSSPRTIAFGSASENDKTLDSTSREDRAAHGEESKEEDEPISLEFLEPSSKPGSLGRLGHHEVLEVLGKGGFGIVVRAFDETLHRMVAIKVLAPAWRRRHRRGSGFCARPAPRPRVRHDNVVHIYAVEEKPLPYLVMEYIPGQTLQQRLDQNGPLDVADTLALEARSLADWPLPTNRA